MSVLYPGEDWPAGFGPRPTACTYCDEDLDRDEVLVMWFCDRAILLHRPCAERWAVHLLGDAREAELAGAAAPHWATRAARALGHRLRAAEFGGTAPEGA